MHLVSDMNRMENEQAHVCFIAILILLAFSRRVIIFPTDESLVDLPPLLPHPFLMLPQLSIFSLNSACQLLCVYCCD